MIALSKAQRRRQCDEDEAANLNTISTTSVHAAGRRCICAAVHATLDADIANNARSAGRPASLLLVLRGGWQAGKVAAIELLAARHGAGWQGTRQ